ncbi:MAG: hypothetical protein WD232_06015 [Acidimicrobiales bacterium]
MLPQALDPDTLRTAAIVALGLVVIGIFLTLRFIQKMVVRVVIVGALVALGAGIWVQREELASCPTTGACTFFGQEVQVPIASR